MVLLTAKYTGSSSFVDTPVIINPEVRILDTKVKFTRILPRIVPIRFLNVKTTINPIKPRVIPKDNTFLYPKFFVNSPKIKFPKTLERIYPKLKAVTILFKDPNFLLA